MRIALCFHGLSAGFNDLQKTKQNRKYQILDNDQGLVELRENGEVDIFVHTWNRGNQDRITRYLQPKKMIIEEINLEIQKKVINLDTFPNRKYLLNDTNRYCKFSRYYSLYQADQLRIQYEKEMDFQYDCVIHTRFDIIFSFKKSSLDKLNLNKYFYLVEKVPRSLKNFYYDYMFISSGPIMEKFTQIYFQVEEILRQIKSDQKKRKPRLKPNNHYIVGYFLGNNSSQIKHVSRLFPDSGITAKIIVLESNKKNKKGK